MIILPDATFHKSWSCSNDEASITCSEISSSNHLFVKRTFSSSSVLQWNDWAAVKTNMFANLLSEE
jgi:hypothetical protein